MILNTRRFFALCVVNSWSNKQPMPFYIKILLPINVLIVFLASFVLVQNNRLSERVHDLETSVRKTHASSEVRQSESVRAEISQHELKSPKTGALVPAAPLSSQLRAGRQRISGVDELNTTSRGLAAEIDADYKSSSTGTIPDEFMPSAQEIELHQQLELLESEAGQR